MIKIFELTSGKYFKESDKVYLIKNNSIHILTGIHGNDQGTLINRKRSTTLINIRKMVERKSKKYGFKFTERTNIYIYPCYPAICKQVNQTDNTRVFIRGSHDTPTYIYNFSDHTRPSLILSHYATYDAVCTAYQAIQTSATDDD